MTKLPFVFASLLVLSGCANLPIDIGKFSSGKQAEPQEAFSEWHYQSFDFCFIRDTELEEFTLPQLDIWDRVREGFALHHSDNPRVQRQIEWYATRSHYIQQMSERAGRYLFYIVEELDKRGMPMEFALLPIVESSFDPYAYSHGRAAGMWQVIPGTAKALGLKQNWWYDGRRDVLASTDAALNYLEQLAQRFDGDWLLALAAYNGGQGNVARAIRKNRSKGRPTDYWSLDLPRETEMYVPKLLAIRELVNQPHNFQLNLASIPNTPFFEKVDVGSQINLSRAAEMAGVTIEEFQALNPGFNRWATDPDGPHHLLVPSPQASIFRDQISKISTEERMVWDIYTIRPGDNLTSIAKRFNTTVAALQQLNGMDHYRIREGKPLLVPLAPSGQKMVNIPSLHIPTPLAGTSDSKTEDVTYQVQRGDSLWSIARKFKLKTSQLTEWNSISAADAIYAGQTLVVWKNKTVVTASGPNTVRKLAYTVRKGDSLDRIASRFNLRVNDIVSWNNVNPGKYIQPGELLTLFVDVTRGQY